MYLHEILVRKRDTPHEGWWRSEKLKQYCPKGKPGAHIPDTCQLYFKVETWYLDKHAQCNNRTFKSTPNPSPYTCMFTKLNPFFLISAKLMFFSYFLTTHTHTKHILAHITHKCIVLYKIGVQYNLRQTSQMLHPTFHQHQIRFAIYLILSLPSIFMHLNIGVKQIM